MLKQEFIWIVLTNSPLILWKVFSCVCHIFGALRSRETCGPLLLREHGFPCGFPVAAAFCFVPNCCPWQRTGCEVCPQTARGRQFPHLLWVKPVGLSTQRHVWGLCTPQPVISVPLKSIFGASCRERLFDMWRLHRAEGAGAAPLAWEAGLVQPGRACRLGLRGISAGGGDL